MNSLNNYNWMDIAEPENIVEIIPTWGYLLISLMMIVALFLIIRHFNLYLRFKLWHINRKSRSKNNTKEIARKLLALFKLEKNTEHIEKKLQINKETSINYRQKLLKACYASKPVDRQHIHSLLKIINHWLH